MKKIILILIVLLIPLCLAEQVLWDDDSNINIYDLGADINGLPLTGATCNWYVFNPVGTLNQSGVPDELSEGIINFTVNQLSIGIYPMRINCTKDGFNGTSSLREIKIVDELSEEYKERLVEINQTTQDIYNLLLDDINITLTSILNLTNLTYEKALDIESDINSLDTSLSSLRTYLEGKWGNEDAYEIIDRLKDIQSDVSYLRSGYYYISEEQKTAILLSIREDSRKILDLIHGEGEWWEGIYMWVAPLGVTFLIIFVVWLVKRNRKPKEFGSKYE